MYNLRCVCRYIEFVFHIFEMVIFMKVCVCLHRFLDDVLL